MATKFNAGDKYTYNALNAGGIKNEQWVITVKSAAKGVVKFENDSTPLQLYSLSEKDLRKSLRKVKATKVA